MRNLCSMFVVGGIVGLTSLPALACGGGGGGCGMGGGGYGYGGGRAVASGKIAGRGPMLARTTPQASRARAGAPATMTAKKPVANKAAPRTAPARTVAAKANVTAASVAPIYTCPMHPQVQWTKPTDCPICGMKLKLKQAKADAAKRAAAHADEHAGMETDEMDGMPGMGADEMGGMDDMMCCPGCMMNMGGMSKTGGKGKAPAASRKANGGSMRGMAGMGCGC